MYVLRGGYDCFYKRKIGYSWNILNIFHIKNVFYWNKKNEIPYKLINDANAEHFEISFLFA